MVLFWYEKFLFLYNTHYNVTYTVVLILVLTGYLILITILISAVEQATVATRPGHMIKTKVPVIAKV